jgi:alpha/beta superfamily hydrolase
MTGDGKVTDGMSALYKNLAEGGFQVVTFDYSGLGQSTGEKSYNPASLVQDARDLINGYKRLSNSLPGDQIDIDCS